MKAIWWTLCAVIAAFCGSTPAFAQTYTYSNTTTGTISNTASTCAAPLVRTFTVSTSYTVEDVNIGTLISHTRRGDIRITLRSPSGTTVRVFNRTGGNADHINADFNDEGTTTIAAYTANDSLTPTPPPYQRDVIPANTLSTFNGEAALGTWQVEICDNAASNDGTFMRADLTITAVDTNYADLSLAKSVSNAAPAFGASISYTLTLANAAVSGLTATGVTVLDTLPTGVVFVNYTGTGSYNATTGVWSAGSIAPGASVQIVINVTVNATSGATVDNVAEISASSETDPNSTPGNSSTTEDDDASVSFTVSGTRVAGTAPTLVCPIGSTLFNWNDYSWTAGTLNNSYTETGIGSINFALSTDNAFVTGSPTINANLTGGNAATETSLFQNLNNTTNTQQATTVITLPTPVSGLQFRVFDIDYSATSFADKLTVTGTYNGSAVTPTLTNGISNYVVGNIAIGDTGSSDTSADGTVVVTFSAPVDTVTIKYGNHTTAPANPGNQWASIHDITLCNPQAILTATKVSSVIADGVNASDFKMIPGATVRYCLLVSNAGPSNATAVTMSDTVPTNLTYIAGSMVSATSCSASTTAEDDNATGADESDPFGASFAGVILSATAATLTSSGSFAILFNATIN